MPPKKTAVEKPFIRTAAEAIGTALGKLAIKTHVVTPAVAEKRPKSSSGPKKKVVSKTGTKGPAKKRIR